MSLSNVSTPYDTFTDQYGKIMGSGSVYIGVAGEDPESDPIEVFWDSDGTVLAAQPLQIINGYICNTGTPAQVFADNDYSIRVYSGTNIVYYFPNILAKSISGPAGGDLIGFYPNPEIAANAVEGDKVADQGIGNGKLVAGNNNTVKGTILATVVDMTAYQLNGILGRVGESVFFEHANFDPALYYWMNGATLSRVDDARLLAKVLTLLGTQGAKGWGVGDGTTTFVLPDRRGYFPRGYSDNTTVDPDVRVVGSTQLDAVQPFSFNPTRPSNGENAAADGIDSGGSHGGNFTPATITLGVPVAYSTYGAPRIAMETRPVNMNNYWCVVR